MATVAPVGSGVVPPNTSIPAGSDPAQTPANKYAGSWEAAILQALGAGVTLTGVTTLAEWTRSEWAGSSSWSNATGTTTYNNPLAVSGLFPGATTCVAQCGSTSPIMAYGTLAEGAAANAAFMLRSDPGIVAGFKNANDGQDPNTGATTVNTQAILAIWQAVNASGWCKGCQGGLYPSALHDFLLNPTSQGIAGGIPSEGVTPIANQGAGAVTGAVKAVTDVLTGNAAWEASLGNILGDVTSASFWERIGLFALGGALTVGGLLIFFKNGLPKAVPIPV